MQRAVERDLEIIGEAIKRIIELEPGIAISSVKNIIGLRNIISHAYDTIEPEMIWGIIQKDIPLLLEELNMIRRKWPTSSFLQTNRSEFFTGKLPGRRPKPPTSRFDNKQ